MYTIYIHIWSWIKRFQFCFRYLSERIDHHKIAITYDAFRKKSSKKKNITTFLFQCAPCFINFFVTRVHRITDLLLKMIVLKNVLMKVYYYANWQLTSLLVISLLFIIIYVYSYYTCDSVHEDIFLHFFLLKIAFYNKASRDLYMRITNHRRTVCWKSDYLIHHSIFVIF